MVSPTDLPSLLIAVTATGIGGALAGFLVSRFANWGNFRQQAETIVATITAQLAERESTAREWRKRIEEQLREINANNQLAEIPVLKHRISNAESHLKQVDDYATELKHVHIDPYVRRMGLLEQRMDQIDRRNQADQR